MPPDRTFIRAVFTGDLKTIDAMLSAGVDVNAGPPIVETPAIHIAVENSQAVVFCLAIGCSIRNAWTRQAGPKN